MEQESITTQVNVNYQNRYVYLFFLSATAMVVLLYLSYAYLKHNEINEDLAMICTQQNRLVEELSLEVYALIEKNNIKAPKKQKEESARALKMISQKLEQNQVLLIQRNIDSLAGANPEEVKTLLSKIQPQYDVLLRFAKMLSQNAEKLDTRSADFQSQWTEAGLISKQYIAQMDKIAILFNQVALDNQRQLIIFSGMVGVVFILLFFAQVYWIGMPLQREDEENEELIREKNKSLKLADEKINQYLIKLQQTQELLLKKNEDYLELSSFQRAITEIPNLILIRTDLEGIITYFNKQAEKTLGYQSKDLVYLDSVFNLYDPDELNFKKNLISRQQPSRIISNLEVLFPENQNGKFQEWNYLHKNKNRVPVNTRAQTIKDRDGNISGYLIIAIESQEQKLTEAKLRKSEYFFKLVTEYSRDVVMLINSKNECEFVSPAIEKLIGLPAEEVMENGFLFYAHPDDIALFYDTESRAVAMQDKNSRFSLRLQDADQQFKMVLLQIFRFFDTEGNLMRKIINLSDASEKTSLDKELVNSELFLQNIVDNIPLGVAIFNKEGALEYTNQIFLDLKELISFYTEDSNFISQQSESEELAFLFKEGWSGQKVMHKEISITSEKANLSSFEFGSKLHINFSLSPVREAEEINYLIVLTENITLRKEIEQKIKQSEEDLAEAQEIAGLGNWEIDFKNHQIKWSKEMYVHFGWNMDTPPPTPDHQYLKLIHPEDASLIFDAVRNATEDNFVNVEQRIIRPNGEIRYLLNRARALYNAQNEWAGLYGTSLDITDRKIAELELQKKNDNITNSINYASRIQRAMLSAKEEVSEILKDSFILFKPKDIVSGDFYWFAILNNRVILAAIDCTGHGVPGAFMSMIGDSLLNQIVYDKGIYQPDLILNELHQGIREALNQEEEEGVRDGMDVVMCVIDAEQKRLDFAGAMNPLYYVQEGNFHEIKGDKKPIGGKQAHNEEIRIFTRHSIDVSIPTTIYLSSDGFQDQFGGTENRKFLTKHYKSLLSKISQMPILEQKKILEDTFIEWKGDQNQTDDVLVIGVKIE